MPKTRPNESFMAVRERELYFNEEKYGIVLDAEKSTDNNVINNIKETRLNL